jgi:hypothetical protein
MHGWMGGIMDGWLDVREGDGWMDGWINEWEGKMENNISQRLANH